MDKITTKKPKQQNLWELQESIIPADKRIYIPNWDNKPKETETVISFMGSKFLTTGNLSTIISKAGTGKSSVCEAIMSALINPECDGLGFKVKLSGYRNKILYIDGERTIHDTWNSWHRVMQRSETAKPLIVNQLIIANFKAIGINERIKHTTEILQKNNDIGLVIFDGGGDFVADTNSNIEANIFKDWINTFNPTISVLATLHSNPTDNKPRGHIGSELWRRSESVLLLRKVEGTIREITAQFEMGKVRNDNDKVSNFYEWNEEEKMFLTTNYQAVKKNINTEKHKELIKQIFDEANNTTLNYAYLIEKVGTIRNTDKEASKKYTQRNILSLLKKDNNGNYTIGDIFGDI